MTLAPWMEQKYGNAPGVSNVIGDERAPPETPISANADGAEFDVTVCAIPSVDLHCTISPALTVVWTLVAPTNQSITVAPDAGVGEPLGPLEPPHPASAATSETKARDMDWQEQFFLSRFMATRLGQRQVYSPKPVCTGFKTRGTGGVTQARKVVRRRNAMARKQRRNATAPNSRTMSLALRST